MLDRYARTLDKIRKLNVDIRTKRAEIEMNESKKKSLKSQRESVERDREDDVRHEIDRSIQNEIDKQKAPLLTKLEEYNRKYKNTKRKQEIDYDTVKYANYNILERDSFELTNACEDLLDEVEDIFKPYIEETLINTIAERVSEITITDDVLKDLYDRVDKYAYTNDFDTEIPKLMQIALEMFMPSNLTAKSSSMQVVELGAKSLLIVAGLTIAAPVIIIPYCLSIAKSVSVQKENSDRIQDMLYVYELLRVCTYKRKHDLLRMCEETRQEDFSRIEQYYTNKSNTIEKCIEELQEDIEQVEPNIVQTIDRGQIVRKIEQQYDMKTKELDLQIEQYNDAIEKQMWSLTDFQSQLDDNENEKILYKEKITETMLNLTSFRDDPMLLTKFFLGFDENDNIMTVDYDGKPTMIVYTGDNSTVITSFIDMMLIQYYTNMQINNLRIDIIDNVNAGIAYDVFRQGSLTDIVSITATVEEESQLIDALSKEMRSRSVRITTVADDIHKYNKIMLERDSIPMEYRILIIQACSPGLLENKKFITLCNTAFTVGIIPIIFVNSESIPGLGKGGKKDWSEQEISAWADLINAIPDKFYHYNADSGEVAPLGTEFKRQTSNYLKAVLNKMRQ